MATRAAKKAPAKKAAKKAPPRRTVAQVVAEKEELRQRLIEATARYARENGSCRSGTIDFLSEVLDEDASELDAEYDSIVNHRIRFTMEIVTSYQPDRDYQEPDVEACLDTLSFAENVLEYLNFCLSSGNIDHISVTDTHFD